ncbi:hypothetical protein SB751_20425 [Cupriavidus sp. SIMBA_020]|uniref:hypothetical protein n=1 Tax=Cupriavidus sp. SIMBA_020 TaxID=3085766 RepID=UPI0039798D93
MSTARDWMRAALAAACLAQPLHAAACGSDFVLGDEVGAAHPASIGVAFAMLDARRAGTLAPAVGSEPADTRVSADAAAHTLEQRLASVRGRMPAVSLLLVESRLWTRYTPSGKRTRDAEDVHAGHDAGPVDGDVVVVTGEAVLRGLLAGDIAWQQAADSGLVVLAGDPARQTRVAALLAARVAPPGSGAMASRPSPARF